MRYTSNCCYVEEQRCTGGRFGLHHELSPTRGLPNALSPPSSLYCSKDVSMKYVQLPIEIRGP